MKFSILAVAAILSTGAHAQEDCVACPNGISVDPNTLTSGTNTCGGIAAAAAGPGSENAGTCAAIKAYESLCCPSGGTATTATATTEAPMTTAPATTEAPMTTAAPATMCEACPDGISVDPSETTSGTNTCGTITADAAKFTTEDATCARIQAFESKCCPSGGAETTAAATTEAPKTTAAATTEAPKTTEAATTEATAASVTTVAPVATTEETTTTSSTAAAVGSTTSTATPDASTTTSVPVASGFNAIYNDDSAGHSFSAKHGFTLASIAVCVVSAMFM